MFNDKPLSKEGMRLPLRRLHCLGLLMNQLRVDLHLPSTTPGYVKAEQRCAHLRGYQVPDGIS